MEAIKMTIKTQFYYISLSLPTVTNIYTGNIVLGQPFSLFTGNVPVGSSYVVSPTTGRNQFIVVEEYSGPPTYFQLGADGSLVPSIGGFFRGINTANSLSGMRGYLQFRINNTDYFKDPDGITRDGMPTNIRPFPRLQYSYTCIHRQIPIYILPGQRWDCLFTVYNDNMSGTLPTVVSQPTNDSFLLKYVLYEGADAIVALKLMDMGLKVSPANADWYKKKLIAMAPVGEIPDAPKPAKGYSEDTLGEDQSGNDLKY